nr:hypothetical protein [Tanacetum cinerariifolium]
MNDPDITMEECIRLEEEKACRRVIVFDNTRTSKVTPSYEPIESPLNENKINFRISFDESDDEDYTIWYDEDVHDMRYVETEFPAIVFNDTLMFEPTVSSLNNEIEFRISFDESDDEDHTVIYGKNSFSYKITYVNDLKTDSENYNDKVNMPSFLSPKPTVSYFDDLDFL